MKKIFFAIVFLSAVLALEGQENLLSGFVKDAETREPIPYVMITDQNGFLYFGISDTVGNFSLDANRLSPKVKFSLIGYKPVILNREDIPEIVYLEIKPIELAEVTVKGITTDNIIKKATEVWKNKYRDSPYLASGVYTKTIQSHDQYLEFLQGFGYLITSGYKEYQKFDDFKNSYFYFAMTETRSSYSYAKAGSEIILEPKQATGGNLSYKSGNREIFMAYRAMEAFGPLSPKMGGFISRIFAPPMSKWYDFRLDSIIQGEPYIYVISFNTKNEHVPSEIRLECKGKLWVDASDFHIKRYSLDFINYLYIPFFRRENIKLPYLATLDIWFTDVNGQLFPEKLELVKYWANNPGPEYVSFPPSRMRPGKNKLVEREKFLFIDYATEESFEKITIDNIPLYRIMSRVTVNPNIRYSKEFWDNEKFTPYDWERIQSDLSVWVPLKEQFVNNNNTYYYSFDDFIGYAGMSDEYEESIRYFWRDTEWIEIIESFFQND